MLFRNKDFGNAVLLGVRRTMKPFFTVRAFKEKVLGSSPG